MSADHDLESRIADFYASEAPPRAPDRVLESALSTIDTTRQRRVLMRVPWRFQRMNSLARLAVAAVAVVAVGAVGFALMRADSTSVGAGASPLPSNFARPSPSPSPSPPPALTETFSSTIHGISLSYPAGWRLRPATEPWIAGIPFQGSEFADIIHDPTDGNTFLGLASQALAGRSGEDWANEITNASDWGLDCAQILRTTETVTIDGAPGRIVVHCPGGSPFAVAWVGDRGYLVVLYPIEDRTWFKEILATVQLQPEASVDAVASPSP